MSYTLDDSKYVILINDDNTMTTTQKRRIVQGTKLVDDLWFLVHPEYNGCNMADFTVLLEYLSPVSRKYKTELLVMDDEGYNGYLKYYLPINSYITTEAGEIKLQLTFLNTKHTDSGKAVQRTREVSSTKIFIEPISEWSDIIHDCNHGPLDQRINELNARVDAKADGISYDDESNELQLMSGTTPIGDKITLKNAGINEDIISSIPQADWDQDDETAADYIKNKPDEEDAIKIAFETGLVNPATAQDGSFYTDENGVVYIL